MTATPAHGAIAQPPTVHERPLASCVEVAFAPPATALACAALRAAAHRTALHFAPARWLLPDADSDLVAAAVAAGGIAIDVEGKWRCLEMRGEHAASVLAAGVNAAMILEDRDCAAVSLFDCPVVIARCSIDAAFDVYVCASYAVTLREALERVQQRHARS